MTMQNKKRTKLISVLIILLCLSLCVGATYAYFTDSVKSDGNIIKSGKLDVTMEWANGTADPDGENTVWTDASTGAIFKYELWEPGYTEVRHIRIKNIGNLAFQYKLVIVANGEVSELADVIDVYYFDPAEQVADRTDLTDNDKLGTLTQALAGMDQTATGNLQPEEDHTITIALKMQEDADNKYQELSIGSDFSIQLYATQYTYESDAFDDQYDAGATFPNNDANTTDEPEPTPVEMFTWDVYDDHAVVTGFAGESVADLVIPSTYNGLPVTAIGDRAFDYDSTVVSVIIPDSIESIGNYAFFRCDGLTDVVIGDGVTTIGGAAFYECFNMTSLTIGKSLTTMGLNVFDTCSRSLTSITVAAENTKYCSIDNCLIEKESNTLILGCKNSIIPANVTAIGSSAFKNCFYLTEIIIPNNVITIDNDAFFGCSGMTSVVMGESVATIGNCAFQGCTNLTSVTITDKVTNIGSSAFGNCSKLESVKIGSSVTNIGAYAFQYCTNLTSITFKGTTEQWGAINLGSYWKAGAPATEVVCNGGNVSLN